MEKKEKQVDKRTEPGADGENIVPVELPSLEPFPELPASLFGPILPDESDGAGATDFTTRAGEESAADDGGSEQSKLRPFPVLPASFFGPILPDDSTSAWLTAPAAAQATEQDSAANEPEPFPALPAFLVEPVRLRGARMGRKAFGFPIARRFLKEFSAPVTASLLVLGGGAGVAGALHLQDIGLSTVLGLSDAPALRVAAASGREDTPLPLRIAVVEQAGTTLQSLRISGLPSEFTLSSGARLQDGDWSIAASDLENLALIPPPNYHGEFDLEVEARALNGEDIESRSARLPVEIEAVADVPMLAVADIDGHEDEPQTLDIAVGVNDPQETLSIAIRGLPPGATLSHGSEVDGAWQVDPGDLEALQLIPEPNFKGSFQLLVDVTAHDDDDTVLVSRAFDASFAPVADTPALSVDWQPAREDVPVDLKIGVGLSDPSEALSVRVDGLPSGARLSAGAEQSPGVWSVAPAEAGDLRLFLPTHFNGPVSLRVIATAVDGPDRANAIVTADIDVAAVADRPLIVASDVTGTEDAAIPLAVSVIVADPKQDTTISFLNLPPGTTMSSGSAAGPQEWRLDSLEDLAELRLIPPPDYAGVSKTEVVATSVDGDSVAEIRTDMTVEVIAVADPAKLVTNPVSVREDERVPLTLALQTAPRERVTLEISGLPAGANLSAGKSNGNGVWNLAAEQTADLVLVLPQHFVGDLQLLASATTFDGDDQAVVTGVIDIEIAPVADKPSLVVSDVAGAEDQPIPLDLAASSPDVADFVAVRVAGMPPGARLSAGRDTGRQWQLQPGDLAELALVPPPNFSGDISLDVSTIAYHGLSQAAARASFVVAVAAVADKPLIEVGAAPGLEDTVIPLSISAGVIDESEELSLVVANLPDGASLSRGQRLGDDVWSIDPADLSDIAFVPPENFSGTARLAVTATSNDGSDTKSVTVPLDVSVAPVADRPVLSVENAIGIEDGTIVLRADAQTPDPSESLLIHIAGLPQGARLSAGRIADDGRWVLEGRDLRDLSLIPPGNYSGQLNLLVLATSHDGETTSSVERTLDVTIVPVADFPSLSVVSVAGPINRPLSLKIDTAAADNSETLAIEVRGLPAGFSLSDGRDRGDGLWTLVLAQLKELAIIPSGEDTANFELAVSVSATDGSDRKQVTETVEVAFTDAVLDDQRARLSLVGSALARELPAPARPTVVQELPPVKPETAEAPPRTAPTAPLESSRVSLPPARRPAPPAEAEIAAIPAPPVSAPLVVLPDTSPRHDDSSAAKPLIRPAAEPPRAPAAETPLSPAQSKMWVRAEQYLEVGDVIAARMLFEATANLGSAGAALRAGETYDPIFLKENGFVGALPAPERARKWYSTALDNGAALAAERIQRLDGWLASSPK